MSDDDGQDTGGTTAAGTMVAGLALVVFCLFFLHRTAALPAGMGDIPGPALFPRLTLSALLAAGVWLVVSQLRAIRLRGSGDVVAAVRPLVPMLATLALIVVYVSLVLRFPFVLVTPFFIAAAAAIALRFRASRKEMVVIAVAAVLFTALTQLVFLSGLGIRI